MAPTNDRPATSSDEFTVHDFDQDLADIAYEAERNAIRALVFDLPARPGTLR